MIERRIGTRSALALLAAMAAGCSSGDSPRHEGRPVPSDRVLDFAALYGRNCAGCHGADGRFGPAPPLNDPTFLGIVPDAVLMGLVTEGRPGTPMPAFSRANGGPLTDAQVEALARGIKTRWRPESPQARAIDGDHDRKPEVPPPSYASTGKGDPGRGKALFARACATCHGDEGRGGEKKVGPIHDPAFLALISDQAIRRIIITGRPDLGMPDFAGTDGRTDDFRPLTPADVNDLVAFIASWRASDDSGRAE